MPYESNIQPLRAVRVYRDDNGTHDPEYVAVMQDGQCYLAKLVSVEIPEWKQARILLVERLEEAPHPGMLDGRVTARQGWHLLLEEDDIEEVEWSPEVMLANLTRGIEQIEQRAQAREGREKRGGR